MDSDSLRSPFLPLQFLVICIGIWIAYHVYELNQERVHAEARIQQALPAANSALQSKNRLLALAQEIAQLAPKDAGAAQIANEFNIRLQPGAGNSAPAK
jgi:hypothetical protein